MKHRRTTPRIFYRAKELRCSLTSTECKLWARVRDHRLGGLGFRRQHAIGPYIADFVCPKEKYICEVDSDSHAYRPGYDAERTAWLEEHGFRVQRFTNDEVNHNLEAVLQAILDTCTHTPPRPSPPESSLMGRE